MYDYQCSLLDGPLADHDSTTYGVNYKSPLNEIKGFHVANSQLPQYLMHIILEGTLPLEVKLMLTSFIIKDKKYFDIQFNDRVSKFYYGRTESRNKPPKEFTVKSFSADGKLYLSVIACMQQFGRHMMQVYTNIKPHRCGALLFTCCL